MGRTDAQVTLTTSNLPIVVINTFGEEIPTSLRFPLTWGSLDNGSGQTNHITDPFNGYDGAIG
ncbi:MAG: hypothetical protein R2795_25835 [Saprospiraceae bacterium]